MDNKKVILGISGGIDSAVSALLLKEKGYEIKAVTLIVSDDYSQNDIDDAREICKKLNIKHEVINVSEEFKKEVVSYFINGYENAYTPSPCVICDERIKFKKLFEVADNENAYYVSTGHYAQVVFNIEFKTYALKKGSDDFKDQTYMLYRLSPEYLKRIIFPLGSYTKNEIREIAKKNNFKIYQKKDSQGICFAKLGYIDFLKKNLGDKIKKGFFYKNGKIIGEHQGYQLYTVGQRRGLELNDGNANFIKDIIPNENKIILGEFDDLKIKKIKIKDAKFIINENKLNGMKLVGRPRFSSIGFYGTILFENNEIFFEYDEKNPQNTRGQHIVFYFENFAIGGGSIDY